MPNVTLGASLTRAQCPRDGRGNAWLLSCKKMADEFEYEVALAFEENELEIVAQLNCYSVPYIINVCVLSCRYTG